MGSATTTIPQTIENQSEKAKAGQDGLAWREFYRRMGDGSLPPAQVSLRAFVRD